MKDETIILLTYYSRQEDDNDPVLRHIIKSYSPAYLPWDVYLSGPLSKIFSRVIVYDFLRRRAEIGIEAMNREIIDLVRKEKAKYVLWTSFYYDVHQSTLDTIREEGAIVVGWFFDDEWRFHSYSKYWIPHLTYCVTNAVSRVGDYQALGAKVIQTIPNTGVAVNRDWSQIEEKYGVSFVGSRYYANRERWFDELRRRNIQVHLFGKGWTGYVPFEKMIEIFGNSKINLNFSEAPNHERLQIKGRVFQVCLAGGFLLTEYAPGLENYFEIGKEIVCFENADEMVDKISYYLEHDAERRAIARAGFERATRDHTSDRMVADVFEKIERDRKSAHSTKHGRAQMTPKMPMLTRILIPSHYHFHWGEAFSKENYGRRMSGESFAQSLSWSRLNVSTRYYRIAGSFPRSMRHVLFKTHDVLIKIPGKLYRKFSLPFMGRVLRKFVNRYI